MKGDERIGKEVFFIEEDHVVAGIVIEVCEGKESKKYVTMFFGEGDVQKRILRDSKYSDDLFGFSYEEFIEKVKEKTEEAKEELKLLKTEFEKL